MNNVFQQFLAAMQQFGLACSETIIADGQLHRFSVEGDKQGSKNGWYILFLDDIPAGAFGCWKRKINKTWCSQNFEKLSDKEKRVVKEHMVLSKQKREQALKEIRANAKLKANQIWESSQSAYAAHPYLIKKNIKPIGIRQAKDALIVPLHDTEKNMGL